MIMCEDFDLDEEFLNDISQKESQFYSEGLADNEESAAKKFKNDDDSSPQSGSKSILIPEKVIHAESGKGFLVQNTNDTDSKKNIRTNLILERLRRNEITTSDSSSRVRAPRIDNQSLYPEKSSLVQAPLLHPTNNESRKTRILDIFRRNTVESTSACLRSPDGKYDPTNVNDFTPNKSKLDHGETIAKLKPATSYNKPIALVRQFPGPAGLLPHSSGRVIPALFGESSRHDDSNDGTENNENNDTSMISEYCSQNTKNSYSEGAWELLLSDLSPDFLSGHDISTVKQKVWTNSYRNNKVPFLAGIVQRVDFSSLDPLVVLKDSTGTIEGTICKDILVEYPHSLDIGVVLFLGDIGLLTVGSYPKKCHVIITLKNIINVYTPESKIFSISEMDARLRNLNKCGHPGESLVNRISNSSSSNSKLQDGRIVVQQDLVNKNMNPQISFSSLKNDSYLDSSSTCGPVVTKESLAITNKHNDSEASKTHTHRCENISQNNNINLNSFQDNTNTPRYTSNSNSKSSFESGDLQNFYDDCAFDDFFDIDDNLVSVATENGVSTTHTGIEKYTSAPPNKNTVVFGVAKESSALAITDFNVNLPPEPEHSVAIATNVCNGSTKKSEATDRKMIAASESRTSDIRLKLSVFRSKTELTQEPCDDLNNASTQKIHKQSNKRVEASFASAFLFNEENDSDEELFSQLDVESIASDYNKLDNVTHI